MPQWIVCKKDLQPISASYCGRAGLALEVILSQPSLGFDEWQEVYLFGMCRFVAIFCPSAGRGFQRICPALSDAQSRAERRVWSRFSKCRAQYAEAGGWED